MTKYNKYSLFAKKLKQQQNSRLVGVQLKQGAQKFAEKILSILFPHFSNKINISVTSTENSLLSLEKDLSKMLVPILKTTQIDYKEVINRFMNVLPEIHDKLCLDAEAITSGDPAAENVDEVILAYPGFTAIAMYRIAHEFYSMHVPIFPRLITEYAHQITGIDIHPGAQIGHSFAIDHGTGIVIGESSVIGENVKIYQGVTLGALSVDKKMAKSKRHPTIESNSVIYAQAIILGGETIVGHNSVIGGNVWLTKSVPPYSYVYQESKITVRPKNLENAPLDFVI